MYQARNGVVQGQNWAGTPTNQIPLRETLRAVQERIAPTVERYGNGNGDLYNSIIRTGSEMLPGVGDLVGIEDLQNAAQGNDWGGIGLGLLSAIPGIPAIGRGGRGARRAGRLLDDAPAPSAPSGGLLSGGTNAEQALARYRAAYPDDTNVRVLNPGDEGYPTNAQWDDVSQTYVALTPTHQGAYDISVVGRPAGSVSMAPNGRPFVDRIQIDPAFQRQGVGGQVYDQLEETLGVPLVPSPLGLSDEAQGFWRKRLDALPPDQARHRIDEAMGYGQEFGVDAYDRLNPLRPQAVEPDYPIRAFHGSPHSFDRFSLDKIGTGEGAQAYGHGLYFAESEDVARGYRDQLQRVQPSLNVNGQRFEYDQAAALADQVGISERAAQRLIQYGATGDTASLRRFGERQRNSNFDYERADSEAMFEAADAADRLSVSPGGSMYEVGINADPNMFLDWDRPLSEQPEVLQRLGFANMDEDAIHAEAARIFEAQPGGAWMEDPVSKARIDELNTMLERRPPIGTGQDFYRGGANNDVSGILSQMGYGDPAGQSQYLREAGIPGIRYLDAGSRGAADVNDLRGTRSMWEAALRKSPDDAYARSMFEEADAALRQAEAGLSSNYVLFDDELVKIIRKYGISGLGLGAGLSAFGYNEPAEQSLPDL